VAVGEPALDGLVTALSTTLTTWPPGIELVPDMKQVAWWLVLLTLQNPIEVVVETFVSYTCAFRKVDRSVVEGNVIVIWLFAEDARAPVEETVKATEYVTPLAPGAELLNVTPGWLIWLPDWTV
jgi:hypothetical protein